MKKQNTKDYQKNYSADYYSEDVFELAPIYGMDNSVQKKSDDEDYPIESWGWSNNTD